METIIAIVVVVLIIVGAIIKIVRDKKKGTKCIGCPAAQTCAREVRTICDTGLDEDLKEEEKLN